MLRYQSRIDSLTTGPWKAAATNPDLVQVRSLAQSTQQQLVQAVSSHIGQMRERLKALDNLQSEAGASIALLPAMEEEEIG